MYLFKFSVVFERRESEVCPFSDCYETEIDLPERDIEAAYNNCHDICIDIANINCYESFIIRFDKIVLLDGSENVESNKCVLNI